MKIGIIHKNIEAGGVTKFLDNILKCFNISDELSVVFFTDDERYKDIFIKFKNILIKPKFTFLKPVALFIWDWFLLLMPLRKENLDAVIYPKNIIPLTHHIFLRAKKINIVHDLAYFEQGLNEYRFFDRIYMKLFLRLSCKLSDATLAVSEATKKDIVERFGIDKDKIFVIHEASTIRMPEVLETEKSANLLFSKYKINKPYIFYCGSLSPRKNILRCLQAFDRVKDHLPHNLYLAGGPSWHDQEVIDYLKTHLEGRVFRVGFISEDDLPVVYTNADLYLYPSLYEGFGLPILEAQTCGCPVLTSRLTSCPEVAGGGAHYVDALSVDDIARGISKVVTDRDYRQSIIDAGYKNLNRFSWKKTAEKIIEVIK